MYAGEIAAAGLLGKIYLYLIGVYEKRTYPSLWNDLDQYLQSHLGKERQFEILLDILDHFPPSFLDKDTNLADYLSSPTSGFSHRSLVYKSFLLLLLARDNPSLSPYQDLFTPKDFFSREDVKAFSHTFENFFSQTPVISSTGDSFFSFLKFPFLEHPDSIADQIDYIKRHWSSFLPEDLLREISRTKDFIRESYKEGGPARKATPPPGIFPGHDDSGVDSEYFSQDQDWMSNAVLIAKNAYVWLDQLSKKYGREFTTIGQIPEKELAKLVDWGINCLWLIGIWERSPASKEIKRLCGNPEAIPSAYSIFDYIIAEDLGGEESYLKLQEKSTRVGLRLAADMVPNHMGIDSEWVRKYPGRFLSLDEKPYPSYSYTGPDLSGTENISIFLEDHYYSTSDAAVVFKRVDHLKNETRYIYHGNDGTAMPWNDTAQLNYLRKDVRQEVISTILKVAEKFSVIRFDAAMTLTKRHYQRLWFPPPGQGGAIPTRAEHGLSKDEFQQRFPDEFWKEVVERIAEERPDTLLIAEAFWMMEGYFVRNLGMHRVYNSAFMHMLRDENNAKYRKVLLDTLSHDPRILKRFVNFMNNPDEETALSQFGKGGKYFGICTMMATLPGLPMFGHGQIQGLHEKYGMEYKKAYYEEVPDQDLIDRHKREIFPLLKKRSLFSGADHFVLYDFTTHNGSVNQNVFAYSNRLDTQSALVVFNNKWEEAKGIVRSSPLPGEEKLASQLGLDRDPNTFTIFQDQISGLEYIRPTTDLFDHGLQLALGAYDYHVFLDFKQIEDTGYGDYALLYNEIKNQGVPNLGGRINELRTQEIATSLNRILDLVKAYHVDGYRNMFKGFRVNDLIKDDRFQQAISDFYDTAVKTSRLSPNAHEISIQGLNNQVCRACRVAPQLALSSISPISLNHIPRPYTQIALGLWVLARPLADHIPAPTLNMIFHKAFNHRPAPLTDRGVDRDRLQASLTILMENTPRNAPFISIDSFKSWLGNDRVRSYLQINTFENTEYYDGESFYDLLQLWAGSIELDIIMAPPEDRSERQSRLRLKTQELVEAEIKSDYQLSKFLKILEGF